MSRAICAISGGVDSAVAALLLKRKGYHVIGVFMRNWDIHDELGECNSDEDCEYASRVCRMLDIPFYEVNLVKEYWTNVFMPTIQEYEDGHTPNPDVLCNHYVKFDALLKKCQRFVSGAPILATGHYAQTTLGEKIFEGVDSVACADQCLLKSSDSKKDQTFFLNQITQDALRRTYFPLGHLYKKEVKEIARASQVSFTLQRKESMGICFIGRRNFSKFIKAYLPPKPGRFICYESGKVVGHHEGFYAFTVGQRAKLGGFPTPYVVLHKNVDSGDVLVVPGMNHPCLYSKSLITDPPHWINRSPSSIERGNSFHCQFRFMHQEQLLNCTVYPLDDMRRLLVVLERPTRALTVGQSAVFYVGDECLGGARISDVGPTMYECRSRDQIEWASFRKNSEEWLAIVNVYDEVSTNSTENLNVIGYNLFEKGNTAI